MQHHPECPIYGDPKWAHVDECGPCKVLRDREAMSASHATMSLSMSED